MSYMIGPTAYHCYIKIYCFDATSHFTYLPLLLLMTSNISYGNIWKMKIQILAIHTNDFKIDYHFSKYTKKNYLLHCLIHC
mmetsp:Transcript_28755/g.65790  ORF Transcript_28755/g.65790 Transcript_28755/m.65790 type:complete len:81 (-) Transcript_28755:26-268(-)